MLDSVDSPAAPPLVVDLDGTLIRSDTLVESVVRLVRASPATIFLLPVWLGGGRARFKTRVAERVDLPVDLLPWRTDLLAWLRDQKRAGRRLVLATAAHARIAAAVQAHLGLFEQVLASTEHVNLKSEAKLAAIRAAVGPRFTYIGDSPADLPIWSAAESAVLVGASASLTERVRATTRVDAEFPAAPAGPHTWLLALRVHQWLKNLLLFVPLLTSFSFRDASAVGQAALAFCAFSIAASGTYLLNDLWDLDNDRRHPRKRLRPLAAGALPLLQTVAAGLGLAAAGIAVGWWVSPALSAMVAAYVALTTAYSLLLKHYVLVDVLMLALLYRAGSTRLNTQRPEIGELAAV